MSKKLWNNIKASFTGIFEGPRIAYITPDGTEIKPGKVLHFLPEVELVRTAPPMNAEPSPEARAAFNSYIERQLIEDELREEEEFNNTMIGWCQ